MREFSQVRKNSLGLDIQKLGPRPRAQAFQIYGPGQKPPRIESRLWLLSSLNFLLLIPMLSGLPTLAPPRRINVNGIPWDHVEWPRGILI